jgi:glycerate-2-kinase
VNLGPDADALFGQGLGLRKGLVDHATTALLEACGDAVLTGATLTNANDLVIIGVS